MTDLSDLYVVYDEHGDAVGFGFTKEVAVEDAKSRDKIPQDTTVADVEGGVDGRSFVMKKVRTRRE